MLSGLYHMVRDSVLQLASPTSGVSAASRTAKWGLGGQVMHHGIKTEYLTDLHTLFYG